MTEPVKYGINRKDWRIFILALIVAIIFIAIIIETINEIIEIQMGFVIKIIILLITLEFLWRKIINPISTKTVQIMEGLTIGKSIKNSIIDTIPKEESEKKEVIKTTKKKVYNATKI